MIWLNGDLKDDHAPVVMAADRGLSLGDGLFETIKIVRGHPLFLSEHLCRMQISASELSLPIDRNALRDGIGDIIEALSASFTGAARITVARGIGGRGLTPIPVRDQRPNALITLHPAQTELPEDPDVLVMAPFIRSSAAATSRMKTLSYADHLAGKAFAQKQGAMDAVFINEYGMVCSTTMANIFVQMDDGFVTPPLSAGVLPGVMRAHILRLAAQENVPVSVQHLDPSALWGRWVFRTNSLIGVRPAWLRHCPTAKAPRRAPLATLALLAETAEREDMIS